MTPPLPFAVPADGSLAPYAVSRDEWLAQHARPYVGVCVGAAVVVAVGGAGAGAATTTTTTTETTGRHRRRGPLRQLLVQRAASDSMPLLWEIPGGSADREDPTLLHAAARELREETGLVCERFVGLLNNNNNINDNTTNNNNNNDDKDEKKKSTSYASSSSSRGPTQDFITRKGALCTKLSFAVLVRAAEGEGGGSDDDDADDDDGGLALPRVALDPAEHQAYLWVDEAEARAGVSDAAGPFAYTNRNQRDTVLDAFEVFRAREGGGAEAEALG